MSNMKRKRMLGRLVSSLVLMTGAARSACPTKAAFGLDISQLNRLENVGAVGRMFQALFGQNCRIDPLKFVGDGMVCDNRDDKKNPPAFCADSEGGTLLFDTGIGWTAHESGKDVKYGLYLARLEMGQCHKFAFVRLNKDVDMEDQYADWTSGVSDSAGVRNAWQSHEKGNSPNVFLTAKQIQELNMNFPLKEMMGPGGALEVAANAENEPLTLTVDILKRLPGVMDTPSDPVTKGFFEDARIFCSAHKTGSIVAAGSSVAVSLALMAGGAGIENAFHPLQNLTGETAAAETPTDETE